MISSYVILGLVSLAPALLSAVFYLLIKKTAFGKCNRKFIQAVIGVAFGILAITGTEYGIPMNGAQLNCRDGAVLSAGLLFGGPAGIIAGLIGGAERWISVWWGVGKYTRTACTLATILAGFYAALLRKYMFEDRKPGWMLALAIGFVMEVVHLTMVFLTNMDDTIRAMEVVRICAVPMILANGLAVMISTAVVSILARDSLRIFTRQNKTKISTTMQRWLLVCVAVAFVITSDFTRRMQDSISTLQTNEALETAINDITDDISDTSDKNMRDVMYKVLDRLSIGLRVNEIAEAYDISEIHLIDKDGIITASTLEDHVGSDMHAYARDAAFIKALEETEEEVLVDSAVSVDASHSKKYAGAKTEDGFVQIAYDAEHFQTDISGIVSGFTRNRHVGTTGYVLIIDSFDNIVSAPDGFEFTKYDELGISDDFDETDDFVSILSTVNDEKTYLMAAQAEGYRIIAALPEKEARQISRIVMYVNTFMEIMVFAVMFGMIYQLIKRVIVSKMHIINKSLAKITGGDLNEVVNVDNTEEFASLSNDINNTVDTLKRYISEAEARIDKELEFAKTIQYSSLPTTFPKRSEFEIFAVMDAAKEVGGDFYDFYYTDDGKLNVLIADVSGKGIPAAMFMMRAKTELRTLTESGVSVDEVFTRGNNALCEGNDAEMFVTAWQANLDLKNGDVEFSNGGHNLPLLKRANGRFEYLKNDVDFVLAGMEDFPYSKQTMKLEKGDILFLYTDGAPEASNTLGDFYGDDRLLSTLNSVEYSSMEELCRKVRENIDLFVGGAPQFDDITMLALKYNG